MFNDLLFLSSILLMTSFGWGFLKFGKTALICWIILVSLCANLFVLKQITLFGLNATASDIYAVGGLFGLNLLQEYYGKKSAQEAAWITLACLLFFTVMSQIHLLYLPNHYDHSQLAYQQLYQHTPRIVFASLFTIFIVQQFDIRLYPFIRQQLPYLPITLASAISICISQMLDTALFTVLGLAGIASALLQIFLVSCSIKLITLFFLPFMAQIGKKYIHDVARKNSN